MYVFLSILFLLHGSFVCGSERRVDARYLTIVLKNTYLNQTKEIVTTPLALSHFKVFKDIVEDLYESQSNSCIVIPLTSTKEIAVQCIHDQLRIVENFLNCTVMHHDSKEFQAPQFDRHYDMHEYIRMAEYAGVSDDVMGVIVQRDPIALEQILKPYILDTRINKELGDEFVRRVFPRALALCTDTLVKKQWRRYFYNKMYQNTSFNALEKAVHNNIDKYNSSHCDNDGFKGKCLFRDLPEFKEWEKSFERQAFCAAVGDEASLHNAFNRKYGGTFYKNYQSEDSQWERGLSFIKNYFNPGRCKTFVTELEKKEYKTEEIVSLEYLHLPLIRFIMIHDGLLCGSSAIWTNGRESTVLDFSDYPVDITDADWHVIAQYPSVYNRSKISWIVHLNDETNTVPWEVLSKKRVAMRGDQFEYGDITILSNKIIAPQSTDKTFFLHKRISFFEYFFSRKFFRNKLLPFIIQGCALILIYNLFRFDTSVHNQAELRYTKQVQNMFNTVSPEVQEVICTLVQPEQSLLPGVSVEFSQKGVSALCCPLKSLVFKDNQNSSLSSVQSALHTINNIKTIPSSGPSGFYSYISPLKFICLAMNLGYYCFLLGSNSPHDLAEYCRTLLKNGKSMYIVDRNTLYPYKKLSTQWIDKEYGCCITIKKPELY